MLGLACVGSITVWLASAMGDDAGLPKPAEHVDRSPVDLVLTPDEEWLVTANATSGTLSLVHLKTAEVVSEVACGEAPASLAISADSRTVAVAVRRAGELAFYTLGDGRLQPAGRVKLGFEPYGVAIAPDGKTAYVSLSAAAEIAVVHVAKAALVEKIAVGKWPRYLMLTPDGARLAVGCSGDGGVAVVDTAARKMLYLESFVGLNIGQMHASADGRYAYFPWVAYRDNPITPDNIRRGWVTGSRIGRVKLDGPARREAITLDPRGKAVGDPHGIGITPDGKRVVATAAGTHELLVYQAEGLPFQDYGGPGDHIDPDLLEDDQRFYRIPLGGRPMALRVARDNRRVFVANYLANVVQVVDLDARRIEREIPLGAPGRPSLPRQGEAIFYDATRSLDQWYSCNTCHYDGGTNSVAMDTNNDGTPFSFKTVLSLRNTAKTGPWTWHGWQKELPDAMRKSLIDTMRGPEPTDDDVHAMVAFIETLSEPASSHREPNGKLSAAALRGQKVFESDRARCAQCHSGPLATDGEIHDVGLGEKSDRYNGYNTPSLVGAHNRVRLLHDGRARSLEEVLTGDHSPPRASGGEDLSPEEQADLVAYLKTL
jgi:DNA-binding beta-propeller fold protein YncE